ncbi:STAS domain-containing protein [Novosphingobium flavum]|uniref:Anti-sigma factor antagonist n=1 Tax=Novosphingobium flavum TaxID=1778672 RepID=A0A7X1FQT9_9SPHN|nr:STAS domain-containing protein [Novosphingobium flavum]MBC2665271.1 STAS domain-containing protein [Novosphingobium flavum]
MEFVVSEVSGVTKAALEGRLDTANVDRVEQSLTASILPLGRHTMIDLTKVTFIASLGIRMLLSLARSLARHKARLVMFGASPHVLEILETTALSDIIPQYASEGEAIAAISS